MAEISPIGRRFQGERRHAGAATWSSSPARTCKRRFSTSLWDGRLAVPLTDYLSADGSYDGLDIVESGVAWCNEHVRVRPSELPLPLGDVFNNEYSPGGRFQLLIPLPYADESSISSS